MKSIYLVLLLTYITYADITIYQINKGDTLTSISKKYYVSVEKIREFNNLKEDESIKEGNILIFPKNKVTQKKIFSLDKYLKEFNYVIYPIYPHIKEKMIVGNSWKKECPVPLTKLRYLTLSYYDFEGNIQDGELIVHQDVADETVKIFEELFEIKYPIKSMKLISDFKGSDFQSIEADNTSAFNCRSITGNKKKWSNHAYGKAIDINPIENPYISKSGYISHKSSLFYKKRVHKDLTNQKDRALLLKNDDVTQIFKKYKWSWGGDWKTIKDYQHFEKK